MCVAHCVSRFSFESYTSGLDHIVSVSVPESLPHSTAASEEVRTTRRTPAALAASRTVSVPDTAVLRMASRLPASKPYFGWTAAMWKRPSTPARALTSAAESSSERTHLLAVGLGVAHNAEHGVALGSEVLDQVGGEEAIGACDRVRGGHWGLSERLGL